MTTARAFSFTPDKEQTKPWRPRHFIPSHETPSRLQMGCHVSRLLAGFSPHEPHAHAEEELLIALDGVATILIADSPQEDGARVERLEPGSFVYYPPFQHHTIRNDWSTPITYLMFKWTAAPTGAVDPLAVTVVHAEDHVSAEPFALFHTLRGRTAGLRRLRSHLTLLQPGAGYPPHADEYDVGIVLLSGVVETLDSQLAAPALIYYDKGDLHGMRNVGPDVAKYLVFEFHPRT